MKKKLISILLSVTLVCSMCGCGQKETAKNAQQAKNGEAEESLYAEDATLKLWGSQDDQAYLQEAISMFKEDYPVAAGWNIETAIIGSADAKDEVLKDPAAAADVFEFASDQLAALVDAGTLYKITTDRTTVRKIILKTQ